MTVQIKWIGDTREQLEVIEEDGNKIILDLEPARIYFESKENKREAWNNDAKDQNGRLYTVRWFFDSVEGSDDSGDLDWDNLENIIALVRYDDFKVVKPALTVAA